MGMPWTNFPTAEAKASSAMDPFSMIAIGSGIASVFGGIFGAKKQAESSDRAAQLQYRAFQDALRVQKEQERWERDVWHKREQRMQPYRDFGLTRMHTMRHGWQGPQTAVAAPVPPHIAATQRVATPTPGAGGTATPSGFAQGGRVVPPDAAGTNRAGRQAAPHAVGIQPPMAAARPAAAAPRTLAGLAMLRRAPVRYLHQIGAMA